MDVMRVFVNKKGNAIVRCPECGAGKSFSVERFKGKTHKLKLRCPCDNLFNVELEFRQSYRKETKLSGSYAVLISGGAGNGKHLEMYVDDLSVSGIGLTTVGPHGIKLGSKMMVEFVLDDSKRSVVKKQVVVRRVNNTHIGCEFVGEGDSDKTLGFYLMP